MTTARSPLSQLKAQADKIAATLKAAERGEKIDVRRMSAIKIYLAGPMRGYPAYNHPAFDRAAAMLRAEGHEVFSPAEHDRESMPEFDWPNLTGNVAADGLTLPDMRKVIRTDLDWIADNAEAIALLPGWQNSRGARTEHALGIFLGLWIREL